MNRPTQGRASSLGESQEKSSAPPAGLGRPAEVEGGCARSGEGDLSPVVGGRLGSCGGATGLSPCQGTAAERRVWRVAGSTKYKEYIARGTTNPGY